MSKLRTAACPLILLLSAFANLALAQPSSDLLRKAPPYIDKALRERVSFFFQAQVDGKFRLADTAVHEDSKDAYFVADKERYKGFEIVRVNYSDHFKKATVVVAVKKDFFMPGAGKLPVTVPLTTFWIYDQGKWWWHVDPHPDGSRKTPFGTMKPGPETDKSSPAYKLQHMPGAADIVSQVKVDKTSVRLDCDKGSSDTVIVSNGMRGPVMLSFAADKLAGFSAKVEPPELPAMTKGKLLLQCAAGSALGGKTITGLLQVQPTTLRIPIRIEFLPIAKKARAPRR